MPTDVSEIGATGLKRTGGTIHEERLAQLRGSRAIRTFAEMSENDPIITAFLFAMHTFIRGVTWRVTPATPDQQGEADKDFLETVLEDMSTPWEDTVTEILSMLPFGWSYHEIIYKLRNGDHPNPTRKSQHNDGRIGWRKLPIRAQDTLDRWEFDPEGGIRGMWQTAPPNFGRVLIPIEKALLFRTTTHKNNPQGKSVLRGAYRSWYFKREFENIEAIGVERDLAGYPVLKIPKDYLVASATPEQKALLEDFKLLLRNLRRNQDEGAIIPSDLWDGTDKPLVQLELLSTGGRRQHDTSGIIGRKNFEMLASVLADFILLGHEQVGARALGETKDEIFRDAINAYPTSIASVMNRHAIPRLFKLNGLQRDAYPVLEPSRIKHISLADLADFLQATGISVQGDVDLENHLRGLIQVPERNDDEEGELEENQDSTTPDPEEEEDAE